MSKTQSVTYAHRGFWAYDVAAGVFLKCLIDAAEANKQASTQWLSEAVSSWRVWAVVSDFGITFGERWSLEQRNTFIALAEEVCAVLTTRKAIPAEEIASWRLLNDLHVETRGEKEVLTAPVIELAHAIIALLSGELPEPPKGEAWLFGTATGCTTIRMDSSWDGRWP